MLKTIVCKRQKTKELERLVGAVKTSKKYVGFRRKTLTRPANYKRETSMTQCELARKMELSLPKEKGQSHQRWVRVRRWNKKKVSSTPKNGDSQAEPF